LSRPEHGFSKSTAGIALYNGIRIGAERQQLEGRIVFERDRPGAAAVAAMRVLARNGILSITAGDWEGQRIADIDVCGGKLRLAVGAPRFARLAGAALLPVFTVRGADKQAISVVIEPALAVRQRQDRRRIAGRSASLWPIARTLCQALSGRMARLAKTGTASER
jgi:lauroyl/myristoyl acyltransferase